MNKRQQAFVDALFGPAKGNRTEAARIAGYSHPGVAGSRLYKQLSKSIQAQELTILDSARVEPWQIEQWLKRIAENTEERTQDRIKAMELLARMMGMLSEKMLITLDRQALQGAIQDQLSKLRESQVIDVQALISDRADNKD